MNEVFDTLLAILGWVALCGAVSGALVGAYKLSRI